MKAELRLGASALTGLLAIACGSSAELGPGDVADVGPRANDTSELCPPSDDNVGLTLGQVVPNVDLLECDGTPVELHDLCPRKAAYFFVYADW